MAEGDVGPTEKNDLCDVYIKAVVTAQQKEPSLSLAIKYLQEVAVKGKLTIKLSENAEDGSEVSVTSKSFDITFQPTDNSSPEYETVQTDKQLVSQADSQTSLDMNMDLLSARECYLRCRVEPTISCASFSYCPNTRKCRLSSIYVGKDNKEEVETATSCQIYRKSATQLFNKQEGLYRPLKGQSVKAKDQGECAYTCRNKKDVKCLGYMHCPNTNECYLSPTHEPTDQRDDGTTACNFYSFSYSYEYVNVGREPVIDERAIEMPNASFEQCAKRCSEATDFNCRSINYCIPGGDETFFCQLNTKTIYDKTSEVYDRDDCKHYVPKDYKSPDDNDNTTTGEDEKIFFPFSQEINFDFQTQVFFVATPNQKFPGIPKTYMTAFEVHDLKNKRGLFETHTSFNETSTYLYYTDPKQVVSISDARECRVDKDSDFFTKPVYWGWNSGDKQVIGPSAILFRETVELPQWIKTTEERGIKCQQFDAKDKENPEVTISYFVTSNKWRSSTVVMERLPIRVMAIGDGISNTWDFAYFKGDVPQPTVYQIPPGIGCENFQTKDAPNLPEPSRAYSFVAEYLDVTASTVAKDNTIVIWKIWYDNKNDILKVTGTNKNEPFSEIQDFNTGIVYDVGKMGTCTFGPIKNSPTEKNMNDLVKSMKDPKEMLYTDGKFYYIGKDKVRSMDVDVWETVVKDKVISGIKFEKVVATIYYTESKTEVAAGGKENLREPVLLRLAPSLPGAKAGTVELNYFDFDGSENPDFYSELNVENCFVDESQRNLFTFSMPATPAVYESAIVRPKMFELLTRYTIQSAAKISSLRLPVVKAYFEPERITVEGVILERPPVISGFYVADDAKLTPNIGTDAKTTANVENDCAVKCVTKENNLCTGFTTCPAGNNGFDCYLTTKTSADDWPTAITTPGCKFYLKSVQNETINDVPLDIAIGNLKEQIENKRTTIFFLFTNGTEVELIPDMIETGLKIGKPVEAEKFVKVLDKRQVIKGLDTTVEVKEKVSSVSECSQKCLDETNIPCSSFSFCTNTHECRLTSVYVKKDNVGTEETTACTVYHKDAMAFFDEMKGQTSKSSGAKTLTTPGPEECALACREETGFDCRGFDYCRLDKTCVLSTIHRMNLPPMEGSTVCSHYSRKFSLDFDIKGRHLVWDEGHTYSTESASADECAKLCTDYEGFECRSFNYCPKVGTIGQECQINMHVVGDADVKTTVGPDCWYYERRPVSPTVVTTENKGVSNTTFNATLACLFFLGIVLGIGGFVGYSFYKNKKRRQNGVTVRYTKDSS